MDLWTRYEVPIGPYCDKITVCWRRYHGDDFSLKPSSVGTGSDGDHVGVEEELAARRRHRRLYNRAGEP